MLANISRIVMFIQFEKILNLLSRYLPRHFLEEERTGLRLCQPAQLIEHFWAIVDLFADGEAIGEDEDHVEAMFHEDFGESLELVFILGGHDCLAVVKHQ